MGESNKTCELEYCNKPMLANGLCNGHNAQVNRYGIEPRPIYGAEPNKDCDAPWCNRKVFMAPLCRPCMKRRGRYGLSVEEYCSLKQECEACGSTEKLHLDHDHETGKYRGILCTHCNTALGSLMTSIDRINALAKYVERTSNV